jgi:hypothetical protein
MSKDNSSSELTPDTIFASIAQKMGLDIYCFKLLRIMLAKNIDDDHPIPSKQLYNIVLGMWTYELLPRTGEMSKAMLESHLQHLIERGYVKKGWRETQEVIHLSYRCDLSHVC